MLQELLLLAFLEHVQLSVTDSYLEAGQACSWYGTFVIMAGT
jgi:hypothetical protein